MYECIFISEHIYHSSPGIDDDSRNSPDTGVRVLRVRGLISAFPPSRRLSFRSNIQRVNGKSLQRPRKYTESYPIATPCASEVRLQAIFAAALSDAEAQDLRVGARAHPREVQAHRPK